MIEKQVFDVWAGEYDNEVRIADENNDYPFAGYTKIMGLIFDTVQKKSPAKILDVGIGTGTLASKLYECGNEITGVDFSVEMLAIARSKMPNAKFYQLDFASGLPAEISDEKFDFIISTYALHHLTDPLKVEFIKSLLSYLADTGKILIGDIGFPTKIELETCKDSHDDDDWDDDEYYFVFSEIIDTLKDCCLCSYEQISHCAGVLEIRQAARAR